MKKNLLVKVWLGRTGIYKTSLVANESGFLSVVKYLLLIYQDPPFFLTVEVSGSFACRTMTIF
jgi:hypothetical protein